MQNMRAFNRKKKNYHIWFNMKIKIKKGDMDFLRRIHEESRNWISVYDGQKQVSKNTAIMVWWEQNFDTYYTDVIGTENVDTLWYLMITPLDAESSEYGTKEVVNEETF